ncbi:MAG TPA: nucleotidyl transferase AbiEii/AbiGii toxin family protein [Puia sp.]|jgi:hypothetical protein|nr:nucleotidyl transferase AbiEii/AbiGii toxin family protein [Puia sp.]
MEAIFLHDHPEFPDLIRIVADKEIVDPFLIEKDYWIMHTLWGLQNQSFSFALKGGTSLSKGYGIINRFSEDLDILIEPPGRVGFDVNQTSEKPNAVQSRRDFYEWLAKEIAIPGIVKVERDHEFDDPTYYRGAGIRLFYTSNTSALEGVKDGILLEVGFSKVAPNEPRDIDSWTYNFATANSDIPLLDNRAPGVVCYHPGYTFVEKLQTIIRHYRQEAADGTKRKNYMRQYYDVASLLDTKIVQDFIDHPDYAAHKANWIRGKDAEIPISEHPAFLLTDAALVADFTERYRKTAALYYRGQPSFAGLITTIQNHLHRL